MEVKKRSYSYNLNIQCNRKWEDKLNVKVIKRPETPWEKKNQDPD